MNGSSFNDSVVERTRNSKIHNQSPSKSPTQNKNINNNNSVEFGRHEENINYIQKAHQL